MSSVTPPAGQFQDPSSLLDRPIEVGQLLRRGAPIVGLLLLALGLRLLGWWNYPLSPHESALASAALSVTTGGDLAPSHWSQPLPVLAAALSFFLFGPGDGAARLPSLLASLLLIGLTLRLFSKFDHRVGWSAALLSALSPTLIVASTRLNGVILLAALLSGALIILLRPFHQPRDAVLLGLLLGTLPLAHPLGWILTLLLAVILVARKQSRHRTHIALSGLATLLLVSTLFLTRPNALILFLRTSWTELWQDHLTTPLAGWPRLLTLLFSDEFPLLVLALAGVVVLVRWGQGTVQLLGVLMVSAGIFLFASAHLVGAGLLVLTLLFPAAIGLSELVQRIPLTELRNPWSSGTLTAATLTLFVAFSLYGRILDGPHGALPIWLFSLLSLGLLLLAMAWVTRSLSQQASAPWATLWLLPLSALLLLGLRNAALVNATTVYRPGTILHAGESSPGLLSSIERLRRASLDLTLFQFDPRDPTGGHGLVIVVSSEVAQPFAWYLRDFPSLTIVPGQELGSVRPDAQVVIVAPQQMTDVSSTLPHLTWQPIPYTLSAPLTLERPNWRQLFVQAINPRGWREYISFLLYRRVSFPMQPETVMLGLTPEVASQTGYPALP